MLHSAPASRAPHYREYMAWRLPALRVLDFTKVTPEERAKGVALFEGAANVARLREAESARSGGAAAVEVAPAAPVPSTAEDAARVQRLMAAIENATTLSEVKTLEALLENGGDIEANGVAMDMAVAV